MEVSEVRSLFTEYLVLKMEKLRLSEMSVTFYQSARRNIQEYFDFEKYGVFHTKQLFCLEWNIDWGC
jgi:hypothetical protein